MTRIVITGLGCLSPVGNTVPAMWEAIQAGQSGIAPFTRMDVSSVETKFGGEVKDFEPEQYFGHKEARRMDRFSQFALVAAMQAVEQAGLTISDANTFDVGCLISNGFGGSETLAEGFVAHQQGGWRKVKATSFPAVIPNIAAASVAMRLGIRGVNFDIAAACATSAISIGEAAEIIKRGDSKVMITGGTEASLVPFVLAGLNAMRAMSTRNDDPVRASRPFDAQRDGFVPAEGAAALVLEDLDHALARGAAPLAELVGYGCTCDAWHVTAPDSEGTAIAFAMRRALDRAKLRPEDIDYINAHGTSTPLNDAQETRVIKQVFGDYAYRIPVSSTKSMTGHAMSSSGALEAIISIMAMCDGIVPPTINLEFPDPACDLDYVPHASRRKDLSYVMSNSFGFGGQNAILIFKRFTG